MGRFSVFLCTYGWNDGQMREPVVKGKGNGHEIEKENTMLSLTGERVGTPIQCEYPGITEHAFLDVAQEHILGNEVARGFGLLCAGLQRVRSILEPDEWDRYIRDVCLEHPVAALLYQDPLTFRAYHKPRGYPGDAVTIDYVYGFTKGKVGLAMASDMGNRLYTCVHALPAAAAVRERRQIVSNLIDTVASRVTSPRILSLACGHLREAALSLAIRDGAVGELVALDQDPKSLAVVDDQYGRYNVTSIRSDIRAVLTDSESLGMFDLVYATGLFDYLKPEVARRLVKRMLAMTRPGGHVMVPNFVPGISDAAYMEAFMDWRLVYRDEDALNALFTREDLANHEFFMGANGNIAYVVVRKA